MNTIKKLSVFMAALLVAAAGSQAQVILGSFQGAGDSTDAGWINPATGNPITTDPADSFVVAGVPGYPLSLQVTGTAGSFGSDSLELQFSAAQRAAFNSNSYITFTFSVPAWTNGGYSEIYNLVLNAPVYGYNNQAWTNAMEIGSTNNDSAGSPPTFYFYNGVALRTQTVTLSYASVLPAIIAGGESYLQMTFQGNQGGGAPAYIYLNNVVLSSQPYGTDSVILGSFQGAADPTDAGWTNANDTNSIISDTQDTFVSAGVSNYVSSLQLTGNGTGGVGSTNQPNLSFNFSPAQIAAFNLNSYITLTFSVPSSAASGATQGYSQLYNLVLNAPGYGAVAQNWINATEQGQTSFNGGTGNRPNFYFYAGSPMETQVVTYNYSSVLPAIMAGGESSLQMLLQFNVGGGAPTNLWLNNVELSAGPFGAASAPVAPPIPKVGGQAARPGLRIFAGSDVNTYDREQLDTYNYGDESWVQGHFPVSYSFTLQDFPNAPGLQCQIFLVPANQIPAGIQGNSPTGDEFIEYQASNSLWMTINGRGTNSDGSSGYSLQVAWKTNTPNNNPNQLALTTPGGIYTNSTASPIQSPVGTWTLTFSNASSGAVTGPGGVNLPFVISDPNVVADFAAPVIATFGLQPQSTANEGSYIDYAAASITGTSSPLSENFANDLAAGITAITGSGSSGYWDTTDSAYQNGIVLVNTNYPLWVNWTVPAVGYGLAVTPLIPTNRPSGFDYYDGGPSTVTSIGSFVLPQQFNGYYTAPITNDLGGGTNWSLIPSSCLPSAENPAAQNAYFEMIKPPPAN